MTVHVVVHGHFYQPAREHPWLEVVEVEDTAAPAHDWNTRITDECYAPNAAARILDASGRILRIVNNYEAISFNVGPTLTRWLARSAPDVLEAMRRADQASVRARGRGNALAQAYNHPILPLASPHDRLTQIRWGVADFVHRFGRPPEGMWLPETAADRPTLAALAACGLRFTILAPRQAARVRPHGGDAWQPVTAETLDVTRPYLCRPAPGLAVAVFFYDGGIAQDVAFGPLLRSGEAFAGRLLGAAAGRPGDPLAHVATDGETYGHHHRFGEMALAYALTLLERSGARVTNYAAYLADHPPQDEVEIHERSSWSCVHGVERWRADCGCRTRAGWHQRWRAPLRQALDWLKAEADALFDDAGRPVFHDPWAARDAYVEVVLDRREPVVNRFCGTHLRRSAAPEDRRTALRLLEMQRHAMLMFSSDAWFFDELSGPETVQALRHAARVIQLAARAGRGLERPFLDRLRAAESNLPEFADGEAVYDRLVRPAVVDARRVAAHHAMMLLFRDAPEDAEVYAYRVRRRHLRRLDRGAHTLLVGRVEVASAATEERETASVAVLHLGGTEVHACVGTGWDEDRHAAASDALAAAANAGTVAEVVREMDRLFGPEVYTLRDLFTEERRAVLARLSEETVAHLEASYRRLYRDSRRLMGILRDADVPMPREFLLAAEFVVTRDLRRALAAPAPLPESAWEQLAEARAWGLALPAGELEPLLRARLERHLRDADGLFQVDNLREVLRTLAFADDAGITVNLWQAQNLFASRLAPYLPHAGPEARRLLEQVADRLNFAVEYLPPVPA